MFNETDIEKFRAGVRGELIQRSDPRYEEARKVFNGMIDKRPALIVRCAGVADVIAAVNFARDTHLLTAIRGGGHGVVGNAVCDEGLVIDLSAMRSVHVDPKNQTA
jgi:FAD/FMN-containing dehydrogenase